MQLSEEQRMVRDMARSFVKDRVAPYAQDWEKQGCFPDDILSEMGTLGLMGMTIPTEWDGAGTDYISYALALMEIAAGDGGLSTLMSVTNAPVGAAILQQGTDAQKDRFLRPLARGEIIGAFCLTEPQAGSDAAALKTKAVRTNSGWVLNGTKQFITSGKVGGVAIVFAVTDPAAGKRGISAFVVPTDTPGYTVARIEDKLGQKASDTAQIVFDDMAVDSSLLLGAENDGYRIALANLETGRIGIAAQAVGMARAAFDYARLYARERQSFNQPIIAHQAVGFRLADMATRLQAAELMVLDAAARKDRGEPCLTEACMAKLYASEVAEEICSAAIQTLGGYGYLSEYPVEKIYRDVRVCQIYEGTSDIQRLLIQRALMAD
ncbi:acyl-CoA dehydrogenase family protein [Eilatimonas milleporae]|uniref:3-sulfinopropanoyl-CoA desulfinase n=1 Tax=Eilatimonas milleporae TaxID=911205 RepID=A0A3M0CG12_9PROT|nr:acyl-CoA dehydrogenase family protein [Eilatimonas milleporae]RMB08538.1 alkylation response protein AidB-like acyl-CoA dehydrogenase [Eilatimonas milleporae]